MLKRASLLLLMMVLPTIAHGQIIMGGTSMKKDTEAALNAIKAADKIKQQNLEILERLTDKNIQMNVDEFYYIYPPEPEAGKPWPVVAYDSSMQGVVELKIMAPNTAVEIHGILIGESEAKWHSLPARPHYWCVFKAKKIDTPTANSTLAAWRNSDDPSKVPPVQTNKMIVTVINRKVPPPGPVIPDDPVVPDDPVNPNVDAALVAKFKDLLIKDKADYPALWDKVPGWINSYQETGAALTQGDPNLRPKSVEDIFTKHKTAWINAGVPSPPFLKNIRTELGARMNTLLGGMPGAVSKEKAAEASKWFLQMHAALGEAYKQTK